MSNKIISLQVDLDMYERLLLKRKKMGKSSISAIVRLAIDDFFKNKPQAVVINPTSERNTK